MADNSPLQAGHATGAAAPGRFTTVAATLALIIACYALWRLDITLDRLDRVGELAGQINASQEALRTDLIAAIAQDAELRAELARRLERLEPLPSQMERLDGSVQELRARNTGAQRALVKSEASFLLDAAQRSVAFDRDLPSAIVALESADARLASLLDPGMLGVRQQIARELKALRLVPQPDIATVLLRVAAAEEQAASAPVKGLVTLERPRAQASLLPEGWWARGWALFRQSLGSLITVRKVDDAAGRVVQPAEQLLRRQYLQLLLFSARQAVVRRDAPSYRSSLASARQWLTEFFDLSQPPAKSLLDEIKSLEPIDIAAPVPDISASARLLRQMEPEPGSAVPREPSRPAKGADT
jgi:uroporphyrin-III C-methyltransferase